MQNKIQALPGTKRVGNQTSLIHTSITSAFFLAPSFFFAIQSSFLLHKCYTLLGSIPVLFQSRTIPHHAFSLRDPIHACGFNYHLGTAGSPPRPCSLDLGLCYLLPTDPYHHLDITQASQTQPVHTCSSCIPCVSGSDPTFTQHPKIEICQL